RHDASWTLVHHRDPGARMFTLVLSMAELRGPVLSCPALDATGALERAGIPGLWLAATRVASLIALRLSLWAIRFLPNLAAGAHLSFRQSSGASFVDSG